jgi:cell division protein FtsW (lipid II flippase)
VIAAIFYIFAHLSILQSVWPVHGTAASAGALLLRDGVAFLAWLLVLPALRMLGYRGNYAVVALPIIIFFIARPTLFQIFSDPVYQAGAKTRAEANTLKAERSRLTTILRAYDEPRQEAVFQGPPPALPNPLRAAAGAASAEAAAERGQITRLGTYLPVVIAPLALLAAFAWSRRRGPMRLFREQRTIPYVATMAVFLVLTLFFTARSTGKVAGTTPWELFLPIFVLVWAATLAEDAYNLARPGEVVAPRRVLGMLLYGALPVVPFLIIRELGLSVVLAGSLAVMLLVGTRRGWWAALMLGVWAVLVVIAFSVDQRSATRLELAYHPYHDLATMTPQQAEAWAAKLHQFKLFDANVLAGGIAGAGAGRGHPETAPNAADDGFITSIAAQWGILGAVAMVLVYTLFIVQMLGVAAREHGAFERSLVSGLAMLIAIPFWLAVLGGIRVIPLTGVAAAFAAHGGAKLLASAVAVGIVAGISHRRGEEERLAAPELQPEGTPRAGVRIR